MEGQARSALLLARSARIQQVSPSNKILLIFGPSAHALRLPSIHRSPPLACQPNFASLLSTAKILLTQLFTRVIECRQKLPKKMKLWNRAEI